MKKINFPKTNLDVAGIVYFFIGIVFTVKAGFEKNAFDLRYMKFPNAPQPYPFDLVLFLIGMMLVHMGLLLLLARYARKHPFLSYLGAIMVTVFFVYIAVAGSMHAPPAWVIYMLWEMGMIVAMIATTIIGIFKKLLNLMDN